MHWTIVKQVPKFEVAHYRKNEKDINRIVKRRMMDQIADKLLETITVTENDPLSHISDETILERTGPMGDGQEKVTFTAEVIHLPIEQWNTIKAMLNILPNVGAKDHQRIVEQIIYEVEQK